MPTIEVDIRKHRNAENRRAVMHHGNIFQTEFTKRKDSSSC